MLNPFIDLIATLIHLYSLALLVWVVLGLLIHFDIVNRRQPLVYRVDFALSQLFRPVLRRINRYLPPMGGLDISPIILLVLLEFIRSCLYTYFYNL